MNRIYILLSLLAFSLLSVSADNITGMVRERGSNDAIPYATVSLLSADSSLITGAITDDQGYYTLTASKGQYILQVSYVGYTTVYRTISVGQQEDLYLNEETEQIAEVDVKARRPLVERQMDKIVLNVSNSSFAIGNNGTDILRKAPGVMIDKDGNVTVNGKSVEVYIDGRPSYLSGEQLRGLLQGTDGATIDKIEIITNPSSKYDASGQGGIINIKLKRNKSQGLNGTISANYAGMYWRAPKLYIQNDFASLNLNYRAKSTYTAFSFTQVYANNLVDAISHNEQPSVDNQTLTTHTESRYNIGFQYYNFRLSNDWYINEKNTLGFILNVPIMVTDFAIRDTAHAHSTVTYDQVPMQDIMTLGSNHNYSPQHTANLNFTHVFADSLSRELTANVDYNRFNSASSNLQQNTILLNDIPFSTLPDELNIYTNQKVDIYSAKLDFQTAFWKTGMIECGAKWVMSNTFNNMQTDSVLSSITTTHTTGYNYSEQVGALYITASKQFNQHWSAKLGLRGELTYAQGTYRQAGLDSTVAQKPYFDLFPTAFLGYSPTDKWNMNLSYTRRIKRASYYQLNPFVTYLDAHTSQLGNPTLRPEYNHQVDVNFGYSRYVNLAFNFAHTQEMFNQKLFILPNGDQRMLWVNFGTCTTHGGNLSLTELPLVPKYQKDEQGNILRDDKGHRQLAYDSWLTLTLTGSCYYFINRANESVDPLGNYGTQRSVWGNVYACLTTYLPQDCQLSLDGYWSAPITTGYNTFQGMYNMNLAFKKQFLQKRLTLSVNIQDLLNSCTFNNSTAGLAEGYSSYMNQRIYQHSIGIGLSYMFGTQQGHRWRSKVGQQDEASRLGGGGSGIGQGK